MTRPIQITIGCFGQTEDVQFCEELGPLAEQIDGLTNNTAPATISPELAEAIRQARAFMAASPYPVRFVDLSDGGLEVDWEALLGEFSADHEGIRVWRHGAVMWRAEHTDNCGAEVYFDINLPDGI
jgi:hypothetical protein